MRAVLGVVVAVALVGCAEAREVNEPDTEPLSAAPCELGSFFITSERDTADPGTCPDVAGVSTTVTIEHAADGRVLVLIGDEAPLECDAPIHACTVSLDCAAAFFHLRAEWTLEGGALSGHTSYELAPGARPSAPDGCVANYTVDGARD
jgi:hypothetical protein